MEYLEDDTAFWSSSGGGDDLPSPPGATLLTRRGPGAAARAGASFAVRPPPLELLPPMGELRSRDSRHSAWRLALKWTVQTVACGARARAEVTRGVP